MRTLKADGTVEARVMSDTLDLNELERRAYREAQQDGIVELALGITVLAWAAFVAFRGPLTAAVVVALLLLQPRGWEIVRARLTYPRVGHVELRREAARAVLPGVLSFIFVVAAAMVIALAVFGGRHDTSLWWKWLPLFVGMMLVGALAHAHAKSGSARYSVFAVLAAGAGLLASLLSFTSAEGRLATYLLGMGIFFVLAGAVVLVRFLRQHPAPAEETLDDNA
jgi:hypothetical protein